MRSAWLHLNLFWRAWSIAFPAVGTAALIVWIVKA